MAGSNDSQRNALFKLPLAQVSFSSGELSPHLHDRIDLDAYFSAWAEGENFVPLPAGPALRRRGTRFVIEAKDPDVRLLRFTFNLAQTFVLEFTPGFMRVFNADGIILNADGGAPYELATPYEAQDLPNLDFAQQGDWVYIVDGRNPPQVLKRFANNNWTIEANVFKNTPEEWVEGNWPSKVALFEQRAYYGATPAQPQQIWASMIGVYEDFLQETEDGDGNPEVLDNYGFTYTIFSNDANGIGWMIDGDSLLCGTSGAEMRARSTTLGETITPANFKFVRQTNYGSAPVKPIIIGTTLVFVQRSGNKVRGFEYSVVEDQYAATDLTIFADHILRDKVLYMDVQTAPDSYIWVVTEAGELIGCTYEKQQKLLAWHRHTTDGKIKGIRVLPTAGNDQIFLVVEREINGVAHTYIEVLINAWDQTQGEFVEDPYMDCALYYEGEATNTISGLMPLVGKEVQILCDNWVHPPLVVSETGTIELQQRVSKAWVGLPYTSSLTTMTPQSGQDLTVGMKRRITSAIIAVENSYNFYYKSTTSNQQDLQVEGPTHIMNQAVKLSSRHDNILIASNTARVSQLVIAQTDPVPLTIRGIIYKITPAQV